MGQAKQRGSLSDRIEQAQGAIQLLNYSADAFNDLLELARSLETPGDLVKLQSVLTLRGMASKLRNSQKFLLPLNGDILEVAGMRESYLDLLRLPYPITALEFPTDPSRNGGARKCVVLAWTGTDGLNERSEVFSLDEDELGEVIQFTVFYFSYKQNAWRPTPCTFWFHRNHIELQGTAITKGLGYAHSYPSLFAGFYDRFKDDPDALKDEIHEELKIGMDTLIEFCLTVNCENVRQSVIPASEILNKRRVERGDKPFDTYRVLTIPGSGSRGASVSADFHASPRLHIRRGHLRRLASGKVTWVRHTLVGDANRGVAEKSYKVSVQQEQ
ncbi:hypothetical protein [Herbaspirillum huttiense]|uniref:hypothetical protein n=1 Tax=Herbaspirillum huttiense TaxID=863372 RepID=UPI0039AEE8ED